MPSSHQIIQAWKQMQEPFLQTGADLQLTKSKNFFATQDGSGRECNIHADFNLPTVVLFLLLIQRCQIIVTAAHYFCLNYLVDSSERGHVHSLSPHCSGSTDTGGVFTGTAVNDGVHQHLQGVLKGEKALNLTEKHDWTLWHHLTHIHTYTYTHCMQPLQTSQQKSTAVH